MSTKLNDFNYQNDIGPADDKHLKCSRCGYTAAENPDLPYSDQSECATPGCHSHMMGWDWMGWKDNKPRREREKERKRRAEEEAKKPVSQDTEDWATFSVEERRIGKGLLVAEPDCEAPWLSAFGACLVKVYGIRRNAESGTVEFGVGNESPPILGWVTANDFYHQWPQ